MNGIFSRRAALFGGVSLLGPSALMAQAPEEKRVPSRPGTGDGGPIQKLLTAAAGPSGEYLLPLLPYAYEALEPAIDAETMKLHHDRHHAAYVKGANEALVRLTDIREGRLDATALSEWTEKLTFNLSGHLLHVIFWAELGRIAGKPAGALAAQINKDFGSFAKFQAHLSGAATQVQGNGWGVLAFEPVARRLVVLHTRNHQINVAWNVIPLLVIDVWEHAYYLKYKNARIDYVKAFWDVINWQAVDQWYGLIAATHQAPHSQAS